ncbi:autotransporter outer membrane beta-barrel domain-containing protein, partial [Escherichia coli]
QESRLPPGSDFRRWVWITIAPFVTAAAGSNMTFSPSRNGTSLDLQAGLEARVRENITLGVQGGYAHSVSGSSAEGYNGQATLNVTF